MSEHENGHVTPQFGPVLREYRDRRRLSQSRLAEAAGYDFSYVSRLESGQRRPTRDAIGKLADALALRDRDRDGLFQAGGFLPEHGLSIIESEPIIGSLADVLTDELIPTEERQDVRDIVRLLVKQARRHERHLRVVS